MRTRVAALAVFALVASTALGASLEAVESAVPHRRLLPATTSLHRHELLPTVLGETLAGAQRLLGAGRSIAHVAVAEQVVDPSARPETVLTETTRHWPAVPVTIAVPSARPCRVSQLSLTPPTRGSAMMEHVAASLSVRNVSARWCALFGRIELVGLGATDVPVTAAASSSLSGSALDALSPRAPRPPPTTAPTSRITVFTARVDVTSWDACLSPGVVRGTTPAVPVTWRMTIPGTGSLSAPNRSSRGYRFEGCRGIGITVVVSDGHVWSGPRPAG